MGSNPGNLMTKQIRDCLIFYRTKHMFTDLTKQLKNRLWDPVLKLTMRDHATYPLTFLTYLYRQAEVVDRTEKVGEKIIFRSQHGV